MSQSAKYQGRQRRKHRVRQSIGSGTAQKPRLTVFRSNKAIYAQLIDDASGVTIASASSLKEKAPRMEAAKAVGTSLAAAAKKAKVAECIFDRNGYKYHGSVQAVAEGAREGGLQF